MTVFNESKVDKLPSFCKQTYLKYAKDIEKYNFDEYGVYTAKSILYNGISNLGDISFGVVLNSGLSTYNNSNASEEDKANMKLLINNWIHKRNRKVGNCK